MSLPTDNVTISANATIENVTEVLGTASIYAFLCIIFTYLCSMYVEPSTNGTEVVHYKKVGDDVKADKNWLRSWRASGVSTAGASLRFVFSVGFKWALFGTAWGLLTKNAYGEARFYPGDTTGQNLVTPQDVFMYLYGGYCFAVLTVFDIQGLIRQFTTYEWKDAFYTRLAMTSIFYGGVMVIPAAYAFAANEDVVYSTSGILVPLTLTTGLILGAITVFMAFYIWWQQEMETYAEYVQECYILILGPRDRIENSMYGYMQGIYLPGTFIIAHMFYTLSYAFIIWMDGTKPVVYTFVVSVIPLVMMLKSRQIWSYFFFHINMVGFWFVVNVLTASLTGPLGADYAPTTTSFVDNVDVRHYNTTLNKLTTQSEFFLTGPSPDSMETLRPTTDAAVFTAFVVSCIAILLNWMFVEPLTALAREYPVKKFAENKIT